ncbi:hypothetical protein [Paenibacillus alvei]|uniref:hypothetical protein n=1 Tax=Paenibacillus alvei TaxID=44250 RepID=UPI0002DCDA30|nr:hypothetical protein [Paenibacillus alvei]
MAQIIWHGAAFDSSGYAKATREYVLALHAAGVDVKLETYQGLPQVGLPAEQQAVLEHMLRKRRSTVQRVSVYHYIPDFWRRKLRASFGFTYWETSKIPDNWIKQANQMSGVLLPSIHNISVFRQSGVQVPLYHVRPCLSEPFHPPSLEYTPAYVNHLPPFRFYPFALGSIAKESIFCSKHFGVNLPQMILFLSLLRPQVLQTCIILWSV